MSLFYTLLWRFTQNLGRSCFENFRFLFTSVELAHIMRNTVLYSLWFMFITPAVNVTIALLLFEVTSKRALKYRRC